MKEHTINLKGNGNIVIKDSHTGNITINTNDPDDSLKKLQKLNDTQIAVIKKLTDEQTNRLNDTFKTLVSGVLSQKNIVQGNISNVKKVRIGDGDEINYNYHYHVHPKTTKIPKPLTAKIPKTSQDKIVGREDELADLHKRLFDNKQVVLVNGLGGIGKTTLAQVYTDKYWEEYHHVAWISHISEDTINDFINTEGLLANLKIKSEGKEPKDLFINIISELKKFDDRPNLLIGEIQNF